MLMQSGFRCYHSGAFTLYNCFVQMSMTTRCKAMVNCALCIYPFSRATSDSAWSDRSEKDQQWNPGPSKVNGRLARKPAPKTQVSSSLAQQLSIRREVQKVWSEKCLLRLSAELLEFPTVQSVCSLHSLIHALAMVTVGIVCSQCISLLVLEAG